MIRFTFIVTSILVGALARSVPDPFLMKCMKSFDFDHGECPSKITNNITAYIESDVGFKSGFMDELCSVYLEYSWCLMLDLNFLNDMCPSELGTAADLIIKLYTPTCVTYKADQEALLTCLTTNKDVTSAFLNCVRTAGKDRMKTKDFCGLNMEENLKTWNGLFNQKVKLNVKSQTLVSDTTTHPLPLHKLCKLNQSMIRMDHRTKKLRRKFDILWLMDDTIKSCVPIFDKCDQPMENFGKYLEEIKPDYCQLVQLMVDFL